MRWGLKGGVIPWAGTCLVLALVHILVLSPRDCLAGPTLGVEDLSREYAGYRYKGSCIQHNNYNLQLQEGTFQVPILAIYWAGPYRSIRARAEQIAVNMEHGFDLIEMGGTIEVVDGPDGNPSIYVKGKWDHCGDGCRIMTIYDEDASLFPRAKGDKQMLATYLRALIYAHHVLFVRNSLDVSEYDDLEIDKKTAEGKVFKAVFLKVRAMFLARNENIASLRKLSRDEKPARIRPALQEILEFIDGKQELRLYMLAFLIPSSWSQSQEKDTRETGNER